MASLPADRHEPVFGERCENLVGGKRRSDHGTLLKPRGRAFAPDLDIDPTLGEIRLGVVDFVASAEMAVERVGELSERFGFGVAEGRHAALDVSRGHAAVVLVSELNPVRRIAFGVRNCRHTHSYAP